MGIKVLTDYTAPAKVNPYIAELADVAEGTIFEIEAVTKLSPTTGKVLGLTGEKSAVQEAARANGKTARVVEIKTVSEPTAEQTGLTVYVFKLFPVQKSSPRGPRKAK